MGFRDWIQVISLGSRHIYLLSNLVCFHYSILTGISLTLNITCIQKLFWGFRKINFMLRKTFSLCNIDFFSILIICVYIYIVLPGLKLTEIFLLCLFSPGIKRYTSRSDCVCIFWSLGLSSWIHIILKIFYSLFESHAYIHFILIINTFYYFSNGSECL